MNYALRVWLPFTVCLAVVFSVMAWISLTALDLERAETVATQQSENERLALWRMESEIVPLIARESSRPASDYHPVHVPGNTLLSVEKMKQYDDFRVVSSLIAPDSPHVRLNFQFNADGTVISPQVPDAESLSQLTATNRTSPDQVQEFAQRLQSLEDEVKREELERRLEDEIENQDRSPNAARFGGSRHAAQPFSGNPDHGQQTPTRGPQQGLSSPASQPQQAANPANPPAQVEEPPNQSVENDFVQQAFVVPNLMRQQARNRNEYAQRSLNTITNNGSFPNGANFSAAAEDVVVSPMVPLWIGDSLVLSRRATLGGEETIQGCLLDWPAIETTLLEKVADLLPEARLEPSDASAPDPRYLQLASLPVRLIPGEAPVEAPTTWTPLRLSLGVAWIGATFAAGAVGLLLLQSVRLSERRGVFVSAVTHELRTPLTTFRLYTDMLAESRLQDDEKRKRYVDVLRAEAERLGHLVENVLSYSRLERTKERSVHEPVELGALFERLAEPLQQRAQRSEMELAIDTPEEPLTVLGDAGAIERIVFNLLDNACKYAGTSEDRRIEITCRPEGCCARIHIRDHGPGFPPRTKSRLFQPFRKSAREAADSAPGVGLGLSLCRRLARKMRGEIRIASQTQPGAEVILELPLHK